jgi:hypothetical protein
VVPGIVEGVKFVIYGVDGIQDTIGSIPCSINRSFLPVKWRFNKYIQSC